jgi:hypothetical protein
MAMALVLDLDHDVTVGDLTEFLVRCQTAGVAADQTVTVAEGLRFPRLVVATHGGRTIVPPMHAPARRVGA